MKGQRKVSVVYEHHKKRDMIKVFTAVSLIKRAAVGSNISYCFPFGSFKMSICVFGGMVFLHPPYLIV